MNNHLHYATTFALRILRTFEAVFHMIPALLWVGFICWMISFFGLNIVTAVIGLLCGAKAITWAAMACEKYVSAPQLPPPEDRRRFVGNEEILQRARRPEFERRPY